MKPCSAVASRVEVSAVRPLGVSTSAAAASADGVFLPDSSVFSPLIRESLELMGELLILFQSSCFTKAQNRA